ncbi:MAG: Fe(2+)-trafficking protein [Gemmatimonadota bacterium]
MADPTPFRCVRCDREDPSPLDRAPLPSELGERLRREICRDCWEEWKRRQMLLINHYGLRLQDAKAREFLYTNLRAFLFGEGEGETEIDTRREGTVEW